MMDYSKLIAPHISDLAPSGIRKFFDIAAEMKDAISLGVGEPDFVTPWSVREAGIYSLEKGRTHYSANSGLLELRNEICAYLERKYNLSYDPKTETLVTVGGSEAIDLLIRAIISHGDEVLIPEPCFVCYKPCTLMAGGTPVTIQTEEKDNFKLTPEKLLEKITPRSKLLVLPFPNNPTGAVMTREDLEKIAEIVKEHDLFVLSDEIYGELTYTGQPHVPFATIEGMQERTVTVNGFSKAFAMTGWRLGYACGPREIISQMTKIHQYAIMCAPTTSQFAAIEALRSCDDDVEYMCTQYDHRRRVMVNGFREMGLSCFEPLGAFYVFPNISKTGLSSNDFATQLLYDKKVAVVPGTAFGECGEGFIRCSYAYSIKNIEKALERIGEFIKEHTV